jgi:hypothetical protein
VATGVAKAAQVKWEAAKAYLKQEGLMDGVRWGFVDVGWHGRTLDSLGSILGTGDGFGYYFGLLSRSGAGPDREAYLFDCPDADGARRLPQALVPFMEIFCAGDHGTVTGYKSVGGRMEPELREEANRQALDWGLGLLQQAVYCFAENLLLDGDLTNPWADVREATVRAFGMFARDPSAEEAGVWGTFSYEDDQAGNSHLQLARRFGVRDVLSILRTGSARRLNRIEWEGGSFRVSSPPVRKSIALALRFRKACMKK